MRDRLLVQVRIMLAAATAASCGVTCSMSTVQPGRRNTSKPGGANAAPSFVKLQSDCAFRCETPVDVNLDGTPGVVTRQFWYELPSWTRHAILMPQTWSPATQYRNAYTNWPVDLNGDDWTDFIQLPR